MSACKEVDRYGDMYCLKCPLSACVLDSNGKRHNGRPLGIKTNIRPICPVCGSAVNKTSIYKPYCGVKCKYEAVGRSRDPMYYSALFPDRYTHERVVNAVSLELPSCSSGHPRIKASELLSTMVGFPNVGSKMSYGRARE